jgi:hypothetical protein
VEDNPAVLTDDQIAAMSAEERGALIRRLAQPVDDLPQPGWLLRRLREFRVGLIVGSVALLAPWIVNLAVSLPRVYVAQHWDRTWVGFDVLLLVMLVGTGVLGWMRRQLVVLTSFASGLLLLCDAWFDVMTARSDDVGLSVATALLVELPLAVVLVVTSLQLLRLIAARLWVVDSATSVWQIRIPLPSAADTAVRRQRRPVPGRRKAPL